MRQEQQEESKEIREQQSKTRDTREIRDKGLESQYIQKIWDDPRETIQVNMGQDKSRRDKDIEEGDKGSKV